MPPPPILDSKRVQQDDHLDATSVSNLEDQTLHSYGSIPNIVEGNDDTIVDDSFYETGGTFRNKIARNRSAFAVFSLLGVAVVSFLALGGINRPFSPITAAVPVEHGQEFQLDAPAPLVVKGVDDNNNNTALSVSKDDSPNVLNVSSLPAPAPQALPSEDPLKAIETNFVNSANSFNISIPPPNFSPDQVSISNNKNCEQKPEDPGYLGLVSAGLGMVDPTGGVLAFMIEFIKLSNDIDKGSKYYACDTDDKLPQQLNRVLADAVNADRKVDAERASFLAKSFFTRVSFYSGIARQGYHTIETVASSGTWCLDWAASAGVLGAEIEGEVAIFVATILMIQIGNAPMTQIGNAPDMTKCNPVVGQLLYLFERSIDDIKEAQRIIHDSKRDFNCKVTTAIDKLPGRMCDNGVAVCNNGGAIVWKINESAGSGRHDQVCVKWGTCCGTYCGTYCRPSPCSRCCKKYQCPSSVDDDMIGRASAKANTKLEKKISDWENGDPNDPNSKGVLFYLKHLEKLKANLSKTKLELQCSKALSQTFPPTPAPVPTPAPTPYCHKSGYRCGFTDFMTGNNVNCYECCNRPGFHYNCPWPEDYGAGLCCY